VVEIDAAILKNDAVLAEIVERIVKTLHPTRIYLFGSQARGDATQDSDYDLMVLVDHPRAPILRLSQEGHRALWGLPAAVDLVVWDLEKFDARLHLRASLPSTVVREGKLLHAA